MKNLFKKIRSVVRNVIVKTHCKLMEIQRVLEARIQLRRLTADCRGDVAVSTIGGIIIAVVLVGLLIVAIKAFFPGFFNTMFTSMQTKLNANW